MENIMKCPVFVMSQVGIKLVEILLTISNIM